MAADTQVVSDAKPDPAAVEKYSDGQAPDKGAADSAATDTVVQDSAATEQPASDAPKQETEKAQEESKPAATTVNEASTVEPGTQAATPPPDPSAAAASVTAEPTVAAASVPAEDAAGNEPKQSAAENSVAADAPVPSSSVEPEQNSQTTVAEAEPESIKEAPVEKVTETIVAPESKESLPAEPVSSEEEKGPENTEKKDVLDGSEAVAEQNAEPAMKETKTNVQTDRSGPSEPKPDKVPVPVASSEPSDQASPPNATETFVRDSGPAENKQADSGLVGAEKAPSTAEVSSNVEKPKPDVTDGPKKPVLNGPPIESPFRKALNDETAKAAAKGQTVQNKPAPAKGSAVFQGSQPVGGKSLPPWMQTGKIDEPVTAAAAGPVQMVGSHEDSAEQVQESQQEYKKQFSDRKKFFKQQMEETGTVPIKMAPPPATYRDKAPVAEPVPITPVVLSPVQVPPQFRPPTPINQPGPVFPPKPATGPMYAPPASLNNSLPGPKPAIAVHPAAGGPHMYNGVGVGGGGVNHEEPQTGAVAGYLDLLSPQTGGGPTPFPSPESANPPPSSVPLWSPPVQGGSIKPNQTNLPSFNSGQNHPGFSQSGNAYAPQNQYQPGQSNSLPVINGTGHHAPLPDLTDLIGMAPPGKKKHFADSSFYSDRNELFPTFEEQVKLCQDISSSLTSEDNKQSLGARMFTRRKQSSKKWVAKPGENGMAGHNEWQSDDEGGENADDHPKPSGPPPMKYYKSPKGVDDAQSLMQKDPEVKIFDQISPTSIAAVAQGLQDTSGRGVDLFQKRKMKSEEWVVDETNVQKPPPAPMVELTQGNKLQKILNSPAVLYVQSPWEAAMSSPIGSCENAFKDVRRGELANIPPAQSLLSRTPSPMIGSNSPLPTFNQQPSPVSNSPAPPPSDSFSRLPRGWGASSPQAQKAYEPAPFVETPQRFAQQPPSPSPKPSAPLFKPLSPEPIQAYKPFVPTPIYQPPVQQPPVFAPQPAPQPQFNTYQPPAQQYVPPPVQQQYQPPPVQHQQQYNFPPAQPQFTLQEPVKRAQSHERVNTVHRAGPPDIGELYNTTNADLQIDREVPNYQPAPHTVVRRYSQQFDNYTPQYSNQQPQFAYQPPQAQGYPAYQSQQQNFYPHSQAQQKSVTWNPELKQTQHFTPQSTDEHRRLYVERHKQWERPPEPMSSRMRPRSRSQPPAPFTGRQGYSPSLPSPGGYGGTSPTPKWGSDMRNWAAPVSPPVNGPVQQSRSPSVGSWGPDMRNWTPKEVSQPQQQQTYRPAQQQPRSPPAGKWGSDMRNWTPKEAYESQQTYRPVHQPQRPQQQQGTWGNDMNNWRPRYAPQPVTQQYRPAAAPSPQGRWGSDMHNWGQNTAQQSTPRFPPLQQPQQQQQPWSSGYSSSPAGYATLPSSRSRQGQFQQQQQPQQQRSQPAQYNPQPPAAQLPYQQNFNQPSCATLPRIRSATPWSVGGGRGGGGILVSDL